MLLGLAVAETIVLHNLVTAIWGWWPAVVLATLDLALVATLAALLRSFRRLPVILAGDRLIVRAGFLNLALATWPNVVIDLCRLIAGRRGCPIVAVALRLDDPAAFHAAITRLRRDDG